MPKVSEAHLAARRRQILDAALVRFSRQGFHQTPMQAVFEESGLSPGAVYRYFPSKEEIVKAIATEAFGALERSLAAPPVDAPAGLGQLLERLFDTVDAQGPDRRRLAVQVWGEALHNPDVSEFVMAVVGRLRDRMTAAVRRAQDQGRLDPGLDAEHAARVLLSVVQGYVVQSAWDPALDGAAYRRAARALLEHPLPARA